jgi:hypothetical protein
MLTMVGLCCAVAPVGSESLRFMIVRRFVPWHRPAGEAEPGIRGIA